MTKEFFDALKNVEDSYNADVIVCSASIDNDTFSEITASIYKQKSINAKDKALLILTTTGGSANSAYKIARLFQSEYKEGEIDENLQNGAVNGEKNGNKYSEASKNRLANNRKDDSRSDKERGETAQP